MTERLLTISAVSDASSPTLASDGAGTVDVAGCDREPIHQLGTIQPIGFLVAVSAAWSIERVSANIAAFTGRSASDLAGRPLSELFAREALHTLRNRVMELRGPDGVERLFSVALLIEDGASLFDCAVHRSGNLIVIEAEPADLIRHSETTGLMRSMIERLDAIDDLPSFLQQGARQVHLLTGFDRVMVYRFHADGSGEVAAEVVRPGVAPLAGLHYPASDIPQQARTLYLRTPFRIICDVAAPAVPILPTAAEALDPLDLSLSILRAVSPIHVQYLTNMGVSASLSVSIIVEGRLWGLFACHHFTARRPAFELRTLTELFVQMFAMRVERHERSLAAAATAEARATGDRLMAAVAANIGVLDDPEWMMATVGGILPSDGLAISQRGRTAASGAVLPDDLLNMLLDRLADRVNGTVFATDHLATILPEITDLEALPAGLLAIPISADPGAYVLLFRNQRSRSVVWAGNPHKAVTRDFARETLSPRASFAAWREEVRNRSEPFLPTEIVMAETLRVLLLEVVLRFANAAVAERHRATLRQEVLIAELNHRVRNILALIGGLVRTARDETASIQEYIDMLEGRIQALARAHNHITQDSWGPAPLDRLFEAEAGPYLSTGRLAIAGTPVLLEPVAFSAVSMVVHELLTNSAKHGALSTSGSVNAHWTTDDKQDLTLTWAERGGPPAVAPARRGLGSIIIDHLIPNDLSGRAKVDYTPTGLSARFCIPGRFVQPVPLQESERAAPVPKPMSEVRPIPGEAPLVSVLIVEDSLLIAVHLENILRQLGIGPVATAASVADALRAIERQRPDIAILDVNLGAENSFPIADRLQASGVPFLFATGYGDQLALPKAHVGAMVIQKPYTQQTIGAALTAVEERAEAIG